MFRFLRITLILWLLSVALIGGAALYGRAHAAPNELQALGFDVCEGRPCFMGIVPGVTTWNDAVQVLENYGAKRVDELTFIVGNVYIGTGYPNSQTETVSYIRAVDSSGGLLPVNVGDILLSWGTPCAFNPDTQDSKYLILLYPKAWLSILMNYQSINPDAAIREVDIPSADMDCNDGKLWPGFTTPEQYWKLYTNQSD